MNQRPSILLMDEDADILEQLQTVLQREGYQVLVAVDGHAGLRLATMTTPSLIISDLLLAGLDGYDVWKKLRLNRETARIPILVTSALTIPPNDQTWRPTPDAEWQILHYDAALSKPIDLSRFVRVVKKLLDPKMADTIPGGPSVIIASEDKEIQNSLAAMLQARDFGVRTPESLVKALQFTKSIPPAALILDYHHPSEALKDIIWQANDFAPNTVVILILNPIQDVEPELQDYCDGYLTLPFHPLYTITALEQTMIIHSMRRRADVLSAKLLTTNQHLFDMQQALQAQNQELRHNIDSQIDSQIHEDQRGTFTGMVVHDLKSPLGSILGTLNFLVTDPELNLSSVTENLLTGSVAAGNQMLRLVDTLLDGQRLESGEFDAYPEPFDIPVIVDIALEQTLPFIKLHALEIEHHISDNMPLAYADANATQRIIENFLDNAIKYSPSHSTIVVTVVIEGDFIKFSIKDEGPIIPEEQLPYVFDRLTLLEKVGSAATRPGFGLGLTYCRLAVEALGGVIGVKSDQNNGTIFFFTIPIFKE